MRILGMLPSEIERLKKAETTPELKAELLNAIGRVLATPSSNDEEIFLAAKNLSKIGLDRFVSPAEVASVIVDPTFPSAKDFLSGLNKNYAGQVALTVLQNITDSEQVTVVDDSDVHEARILRHINRYNKYKRRKDRAQATIKAFSKNIVFRLGRNRSHSLAAATILSHGGEPVEVIVFGEDDFDATIGVGRVKQPPRFTATK